MAVPQGQVVVYHGQRDANGAVRVLRQDRDGFRQLYFDPRWGGAPKLELSWGDMSAGSRLLAMALLADVMAAVGLAHLYADDYLEAVVSKWTGPAWQIDSNAICGWLVAVCLTDLAKRGMPVDEAWRRQRLFGPGCGELPKANGGGGGSDGR